MSTFHWFEWLIAWRYVRARRREGGISVIAWYSLVGVMLGVGTLIVVQAVMVGFREEFTKRIVGANPHVSLYSANSNSAGTKNLGFNDYDDLILQFKEIDGVVSASPVIKNYVMGAFSGKSAGIQVIGIKGSDLNALPLVVNSDTSLGNIEDFEKGIAIGSGIAKSLGLNLGDRLRLISPDGPSTVFGQTPRISDYSVKYIFNVGRFDIDSSRVYMPLKEAQTFFGKKNNVDQIDLMIETPFQVELIIDTIAQVDEKNILLWTWKDASGAFLDALDVERRVMLIILSLVVVIAALNIISGLVMLVKNKRQDIAILRTVGFSQSMILRVFFICGSLIGVVGTLLGLLWGCLFAYYINEIQIFVEAVSGGSIWNPEVRFLTQVPATLRPIDVLVSASIALLISFAVTIIPARNAAKIDPVEVLRNE